MLLPYSIVTISIVTALLPHLSKLAIEENVEEVRKQLIRAIKMVGVITVPSSVALFFFGPMMTEALYFGISLDDSRYIGQVLSALSLGLVAFSINLILIRGFNAFEDTRTQVISILIINIISVALSYLFLHTLDSQQVTIGLGVAFSASYIVGLFITLSLLKKHTGKLAVSTFAGHHFKLFLASTLAMAPLFALMYFLKWESADSSIILRAIRLTFILAASGLLYLLFAKLFKIAEIATLAEFGRGLMKKRKGRLEP
jgi:putative peptidoglycan lipid II flippase